jgi:methylated-DNA-[protein]-cysteine S-methyltransferase
MASDFSKKVLKIVAAIPRGKLMTYSQVAREAGSPRAYRAVGSILNKNYREREWQLPLEEFEPVPCHRVIRSDGHLGGYARGPKEKERILKLEGHIIDKHKIKLPDLK